MKQELLHSCPELIDYINETGFLPLLSMGIAGWSAEEVTDEDCQYTRLPDGGLPAESVSLSGGGKH